MARLDTATCTIKDLGNLTFHVRVSRLLLWRMWLMKCLFWLGCWVSGARLDWAEVKSE